MQMPTVQDLPAVKPLKRHWFKRLLLAFFIPLGLMFVGGVLFHAFGAKTINKVDHLIDGIWLPATLIRFIIYTVIAYIFAPIFIRRAQTKNRDNIAFLENDINQSDGKDTLYLETLLARNKAQEHIFVSLLNNRYWLLAACVLFDLLTLQLPYFLR